MKAKDLIKTELSFEQIIKDIVTQNEHNAYKYFIPHWIYVREETKLKLINNGFKVYVGEWDGFNKDTLIIEW